MEEELAKRKGITSAEETDDERLALLQQDNCMANISASCAEETNIVPHNALHGTWTHSRSVLLGLNKHKTK